MTAKQVFKKAYSVARSMRSQAAGQAEYSTEHGRYFTSYFFYSSVQSAAGVNPHASSSDVHAAWRAADVVAIAAAPARDLSLTQRLANFKARNSCVWDGGADFDYA